LSYTGAELGRTIPRGTADDEGRLRPIRCVTPRLGPHYRASVGHAVSLDHKGAVEHSQTVPAQNGSRHPH
jgi:hypothetical protein